MPELKRYLENYSAAGKAMLAFGAAFSLGVIIFFLAFMIKAEFPLFMVPIPLLPFLGMFAFIAYVLRRSFTSFDKWWNGLTEAQRAEIERDFASGTQLDSFLTLGHRYAFIRHMGEPILYEQIQDVYFLRSHRSGLNMYILLSNGKKMAARVPVLTNRELLWDELMKRSGKNTASF